MMLNDDMGRQNCVMHDESCAEGLGCSSIPYGTDMTYDFRCVQSRPYLDRSRLYSPSLPPKSTHCEIPYHGRHTLS